MVLAERNGHRSDRRRRLERSPPEERIYWVCCQADFPETCSLQTAGIDR